MTRWAEVPVTRPVLAHTGRADGDDTGYRTVAVHPADATDPDPMVELPPDLLQRPIYAVGAQARLTPYYPGGLGASPRMLLREPATLALLDADRALRASGRRLVALDAFRPARVQARLWASVFDRLCSGAGLSPGALDLRQWLALGRAADDTASFCAIVRDEAVLAASNALAIDADLELRLEILTYQANHGAARFALDETANTAHGSGGACDVALVELEHGEPTNLGVPFDSTSPAAVIDWFEWGTVDAYRELVEGDPGLRAHLADFGLSPDEITPSLLASIRKERRMLFHAMREAGASYFSLSTSVGEAWHFNLGNERGGKQFATLPLAGNACHSLLRNVRDAQTGRWTAAWGNAAAHAEARRLGFLPS